jgi:outer membrane lipoprotein-sorting protein
LIRSLKTVPQGEEEYREEAGRVTFQFQALDYTGGSLPEKYQLTVSSGDWFPIRIERKTAKGKPIEISMLQNFRINTHLEDKLFVP